MGKVRLADIAKEVGVSTVTVHNALSGNKGVSEEVRRKIQQVADALGYQPSSSAKKQEEGESQYRNIGVLVAEKFLAQYETFYSKMYQELTVLAAEKRCFTSVEVLKKEEEKTTRRLPESLKAGILDGMVVIGEVDRTYLKKLKEAARIPIVFLDFYDEEIAADAVISDNFYGMYQLTEFMFKQGIEELGFVGSIYATSSIMDRYCGFMKAMMLHGKQLNQEWLIEDRDEVGQVDVALPNVLPKGFVCNCDLTASILIDKLAERGVRVPEDVAVIGFDNYLYPGLADFKITTYEVDTRAMCSVALKKLLKQLKNPRSGRGLDIVSGHMVIKQTVRLKNS